MKRKIIIGICLVALVGLVAAMISSTRKTVDPDVDTIHAASVETGDIGEKIVGNPDTAEMVLYEYADFTCAHCAEWNRIINSLMEKYDGKIALVFRTYNLGSANGPLAACAATAAQIQGYFKEYKDLLFNNQSEWCYEEDANELVKLFAGYFEEASNSLGDVNKFTTDIKSDAVKDRTAFEYSMGKKTGLTGTPTFRIDGKAINLKELKQTIEDRLSS
ncbi:thioredoxin domain-containing protein [Candidatus Saccharibacteria bacterium]|nr:thioredoxin domain-containing protein [Candidatus Saccharibacteria bacterium]MBR0424103.1 thioredoxin domain-containing protein [Candidatus Saccharibacteria bacterium]